MPKETELGKVKEIAKEQRSLVELFKKGLNSAESISTEEYFARQLEIINKLRALIGEPPLVWGKTDEGGFPILVESRKAEP
jgi:hypothetical protein